MRKELKITEIKKMSYETRLARFKQEETELFSSANGKSTQEIAEEHRKLVERWKV